MTELSTHPCPQQPQPEDSPATQAACTRSVRRTVPVEGSGGVAATVVVIAQQGQVKVSIVPPFTWDVIMESEKTDEVINALASAREDAKKMMK